MSKKNEYEIVDITGTILSPGEYEIVDITGTILSPGEHKIVDITGTILSPGEPEKCLGNGEYEEFECCCDECDFYLFCYSKTERINNG